MKERPSKKETIYKRIYRLRDKATLLPAMYSAVVGTLAVMIAIVRIAEKVAL